MEQLQNKVNKNDSDFSTNSINQKSLIIVHPLSKYRSLTKE